MEVAEPSASGEKIPAMTISPDAGPGYEPEPYGVPRGTCPSCRSGRVTHHVYGYPVDPQALDDLPAWVEHGGCVREPWTRSCAACGATWDDRDDVALM
jgi:hypothetical protein